MTLYEKIREAGLNESLHKLTYYLRGLAYRHRFERCGWIQVRGRIYIQKKNARIYAGRCVFWKGVKLDLEGPSPNSPALLEIGDFTTIGDRTEIHAAQRVSIGRRCKIAWDCVILDRDYHDIAGSPERVDAVCIEDDVWLGCRVIVLPGVRIGRGSVVGAGSVVTRSIEPYCLVAGNPARFIRTLASPSRIAPGGTRVLTTDTSEQELTTASGGEQ